MIILRQKQYTRAEKEAMFQLMRLTKGFKSLPKELNSVENAKRFKKFSNRLVKFANDPEVNKLSAEELKEMKGFLSDIGATKFADNFEPIINKYYGNNNIDAWKRLKLNEEKLPDTVLINRDIRLLGRISGTNGTLNTQEEINSIVNAKKSVKGKSSKEIFSSPDGKLMKNIIKGETGGVGQPGIYFNKVKGRNRLSDRLVSKVVKEDNLTKDAKKELLRNERAGLRGDTRNFFTYGGNGDYGQVFISKADPSILSHELGHGKSTADSIAAGTIKTERISGKSKKLSIPLNRLSTEKRVDALHLRLDNLSTIAEENMANAYGRDIIRKYGGKNVDKYLNDFKMAENVNMKYKLNKARHNDVAINLGIADEILNRRGIY